MEISEQWAESTQNGKGNTPISLVMTFLSKHSSIFGGMFRSETHLFLHINNYSGIMIAKLLFDVSHIYIYFCANFSLNHTVSFVIRLPLRKALNSNRFFNSNFCLDVLTSHRP